MFIIIAPLKTCARLKDERAPGGIYVLAENTFNLVYVVKDLSPFKLRL